VDDRRIALELSCFPLLLLEMRARRTPDDLRAMFDGFRAANRRALAEKVRWVLVATTGSAPTASERRSIIDEANKFSRREHEICQAAVLVIPNDFVRGFVTLFSWMIPNLSPLLAAATTDAAVELAVARLRKIGAQYPPELARRAAEWFHRDEASQTRRVGGGSTGAASSS
jgi:hypothetical protein